MKESWLEDFKADLNRLSSERLETKVETPKLRVGERRTVTILFLDLKGFTSISETLDPEELHFIVDNCFKIFTKDIEDFGGYVDKYEGDCIMALFGAKKSSEFDTEFAVRAALRMYSHLDEINKVLEDKNIKLGMRVGINCGLVVAGFVGKERHGDFTVYGDAVNLASRLESNAPVGKILISEEVYKQIKNKFECKNKGTIQVKGRAAPVRVFTVEGECNKGIERWERSFIFQQAPFVNRVAEMEAIKKYFSLHPPDLDGGFLVLTIQGPAGIGKSRLLYEWVKNEWSNKPKKIILKSWCIAYESSYYPFILMIRQGIEFVKETNKISDDREVLEYMANELPENDRQMYLNNFPYLFHLIGISSEKSLTDDPRERQLKFLLSIRNFMQALLNYGYKNGYSFVILFDDVHWIDMASREAMVFFLDQVKSKALRGVFLIFRDEHNLHQIMPSTLHCFHLHLKPLSESDCKVLIEKTIGRDILPPKLLDNILSLSQGNPYFLEEILLSLHERGFIHNESGVWKWMGSSSEIPIPTTIESLLLNRIDCLPKQLKEIMQIASVLGRKFEKPILESILQKLGEHSEELDNHLNLLCRLGLLQQDISDINSFCFSQNLFHQIVYHSLLVANRALLHKLAGDCYKEKFKSEECSASPFIAYHYLESSSPRLALRSLVYTVQQWVRDFRSEEALRLADKGLALLAGKELQLEEKNYEWKLLLEKERIAELTGDHQTRKAIINRLLEHALKEQNKEKEAKARNKLAWYSINMGDFNNALKEAQAVLNISELQGSLLHADAFRYLGLCCDNFGSYKEAEAYLKNSLKIRRELKDDHGEARDLSSLSTFRWRQGEYEKAINNLKQSLKIREARGDLRGIAHDRNNLGLIYWSIGDLETSISYYHRALDLYREIGDRRGEGNTLSNLSLAFYYQNRLADAIEYANSALELSEKYKLFRLNINSRIYLVKILLSTEGKKDFDTLSAMIETTISDARRTEYIPGIIESLCVKADLLKEEKKLEEAYAFSSEAVQLMEQHDLRDEEIYWTYYQVLSGLGKEEEAKDILNKAFSLINTRLKNIIDNSMKKLYINGNPIRKKIFDTLQKGYLS